MHFAFKLYELCIEVPENGNPAYKLLNNNDLNGSGAFPLFFNHFTAVLQPFHWRFIPVLLLNNSDLNGSGAPTDVEPSFTTGEYKFWILYHK